MGESFKKIRFIILILLGVILLSAFISFIFVGPQLFNSLNYFVRHTAYGTFVGISFWAGNSLIGYLTATKLDWSKNVVRSNFISLLSFILYGIIISILVPYIFEKYVYGAAGEDLKRSVVFSSFINLAVDIVVISIYYSYYIVKHLKKTIESEKNLKRENLIAKYEALKNQVNPHFLFNSLNTLTGVVEQDQKKAVVYIAKLSNTYRYVLEQRDKELISVSEELKFVEDYIFLAKLRHGDGLLFIDSIQSREALVAPLGIQILIENSIKHNVIEDDRPLTIRLYEEDDYIVVENNLQKKNVIAKEEKIGLDNLTNRYSLLTDRPVIVSDETIKFVVKIPLL